MPNNDSSPGPQAPRSSKSRNKPERNSPANLVMLLVVIGLIISVSMVMFNESRKPEAISFSKFVEGIKDGTYSKENVYNLRFSRSEITFQDQPVEHVNPWRANNSNKPRPKLYSIASVSLNSYYSNLTELLLSKGIDFKSDEAPSEVLPMLYLYGLPILFFVLIFFMFRKVSGAGSAMSFGRSRGRMHAQEDLDITFENAAGIDEAVEELREIVEFLRNPGKYQALGGRIPRGVLLVGPPGTGKTLLAKAVAGEAKVPFFSLSGSDFVEMFVGVGAARVRDMFAQAGAKSPSIIFIDELDALGKVRGSGIPGGHDERDQTLNALLVEMDGFSSDQSVIVMAATNRPETLDPALLRPGRFDRHVLVDRPDVKGREAILKVHIAKVKIDDNVDLKYLARLTPGFVGADLANLVNEAALLAARNGKSKVTMKEFEEGIERVVAGLEKTTRIISPDEKTRVSYHECGHALVACCLPHTDPVHKISIIPRGLSALGYTLQRPEDEKHLITESELRNRICVLLGGIATEEIVFQETSTGASNDLERATDLARRMIMEFGMSPKLGRVNYRSSGRSPFLGTATSSPGDYVHSEETIREIDVETKRILDEASQTVHSLLVERRAVLEHMARDLLEREVMDADQLRKILDEHAVPQLKPGTFVSPAARDVETDTPAPQLRTLPENDQATGAAGA